MPQIIQFAGGRSIVHELKRDSSTVGRSVKAHVRIHDRAASREHFRIDKTESGWKLVDLGSQNGTFLNGAQVHGEAVLRIGDRIDAGVSTFFFGKVVRPSGEAPKADLSGYETQRFLKPVERAPGKIKIKRLLKEREQFQRMLRINRDLNSEKEIPAVLDGILDAVLELTNAERGFLILAGKGGPENLEFAAARNLRKEDVEAPEFQISRSIAREVLQSGKAVLTQNAEDDERFRKVASVHDRKLLSIVCLPLLLKGRTLGVVYIDNPFVKGVFTEEDLELLAGFADQAAAALHSAQLFEAASHDALTGLLGHPAFEEEARRRIAEGLSAAAAVILDLDLFKGINDLYGHEAGNRVLKAVAGTVREACAKAGAAAARFGGDEFEVFLPGRSSSEARAFAEDLREAVGRTALAEGGRDLRITMSAGVAALPRDGPGLEEVLRRADEALYRAKRLGRNRVCAAGEDPGAPAGGLTGRPEIDRLAFSRDGLMMMGCIARLLEADLSLDRVLGILLDAAIEGLGAEESAFHPVRPWGREIAGRRRGSADPAEPRPEVVESLETVLAEAAGSADDRLGADLPPHVAGAALRGKGGLLGALAVRRPPERPFIEQDRELLRFFAGKAGRPLENALQFGVSQEELGRVSRALHDGVRRFEESFSWGGLIGRSRGIREAVALLDKVKDSDLPVLILGESGTGKELAARALHFRSPRRDRMFVSENCAAIPESLLESELFGHVRGAFTGAEASRKGLLEAADGGTLFLDEVGDMSLPMQAKVLRFLQEGEFRPVGARENRRVDVRVVAATNRDLARLAEEGGFRDDLFYRLNTVVVRMPPLRESREDLPLLAEAFLARAAREEGGERKAFTDEALALLQAWAWPGNVRELQNEVLRCAVMCPGRAIGPEWLSPQVREGRADAAGPEDPALTLKAAVKETEKTLIQRALAACGGNKTHAARMLGLSWLGLQKKMDRYGLR